MNRSRRAARRNAGYVLTANDTSARSLRIALHNKRKSDAESSKNNKNKRQNPKQTISPTKWSRHNVITRQSLRSIGKKARHQLDDSTATMNEVDANNSSTTTKDHLTTTVRNDIIETNENTATDKSILVNDTCDMMRFIDSSSIENESEVEDTMNQCTAIMQKDNNDDDGKESNIANSIDTSTKTRKSKECAIEQMRASLLPPMPPLLDNLTATQLIETQQNNTSRAGTPTSISFLNNNDELSFESFQSRYNGYSTYSQTSSKSNHLNGKI